MEGIEVTVDITGLEDGFGWNAESRACPGTGGCLVTYWLCWGNSLNRICEINKSQYDQMRELIWAYQQKQELVDLILRYIPEETLTQEEVQLMLRSAGIDTQPAFEKIKAVLRKKGGG